MNVKYISQFGTIVQLPPTGIILTFPLQKIHFVAVNHANPRRSKAVPLIRLPPLLVNPSEQNITLSPDPRLFINQLIHVSHRSGGIGFYFVH